jgi:hypothetical protein
MDYSGVPFQIRKGVILGLDQVNILRLCVFELDGEYLPIARVWSWQRNKYPSAPLGMKWSLR